MLNEGQQSPVLMRPEIVSPIRVGVLIPTPGVDEHTQWSEVNRVRILRLEARH